MSPQAKSWTTLLSVLAGMGVVYFVVIPQDLPPVLAVLERILALTQTVSPWIYALCGVPVAVLGVQRVLTTMARLRAESLRGPDGPSLDSQSVN